MIKRNHIKLGWRRVVIASTGIAIATGCCNLVPNKALALTQNQLNAQTLNEAEPQAPMSASHNPALPAFRSANHALLQRLALRKAKPTNHGHKLRLHNLCSKTVEIVVRYQDPQQTWRTQGGVTIIGKTSRYLTTSSSQPLELASKRLYYHGTSPNSELVWNGNGSHQYIFGEQVLNMRIHYAATDILDDYSLFILCAEDTK